MQNLEKLFQRWGGGFIIFFFGAIPIIPFDVLGLFCGAVKYDIKKFYIASVLGKIVRYSIVAFAGSMGVDWLLNYI